MSRRVVPLEISQKVRILSEAGKYDICSSSASKRQVTTSDAIGNAAAGGICHTYTPDGRCASLFKTLYTNSCNYDCKYCSNSTKCSKKTIAKYEPDELARVFINLYVRNYVEGLFLSSGVAGDPDRTTEGMLECIQILREKYKFHGYVHFKALPGVSRELLKRASEYADRISINIEAPNASRMSEISSVKNYTTDIIKRQLWIKGMKLPSGQTTQMVVGSSDETDLEILNRVKWEYENVELRRAYFSAFIPVKNTKLENKKETPKQREHRLYNVDWLLRVYKFEYSKVIQILDDNDMLPRTDPKLAFAKKFIDRPVDINEASYQELLMVPGIGPKSARRIRGLQSRGRKIRAARQLHHMGVAMKRAAPFLKINGRSQETLGRYMA